MGSHTRTRRMCAVLPSTPPLHMLPATIVIIILVPVASYLLWFDETLECWFRAVFFDAPDAYIGAGNNAPGTIFNPSLMREGISDVIRNTSGGRTAAFAEVYSDPALLHEFGFDGGQGDGKICPTHSAKTCPPQPRVAAIGRGISGANSSLIESAMSGPGSVDDMTAQPFHAPGAPYRAAYMYPAVTASWLPGASAFENGMDCSMGAGATYAPPDFPEPIPLAECFERCEADPNCSAVRVDWWAMEANWSTRYIGCGLRGGVNQSACTMWYPCAERHNNSCNVRYSTFAADAPAR
jgi:hypothetical protein